MAEATQTNASGKRVCVFDCMKYFFLFIRPEAGEDGVSC